MFPSGNYFREIPCPFYSRVTCPRPHCHYKHAATSVSSSSVPSTPSLQIPPDANETLNKLINQLSSAAGTNVSSSNSSTPISSSSAIDFTSILQTTLVQSLTTAFTQALNAVPQNVAGSVNCQDVSEKLTQAIVQIATTLNPPTNSKATTTKKSTVPEYRPTPIAELERRKRAQQSATTSDESIDEYYNPYAPASFSPPSTSQSNEEIKTKPSSSLKSNSNSNESDDFWVTPPAARRQASSTSSLETVEKKKTFAAQKSTTNSISLIKSSSSTSIERIPKKSRLAEIDMDRVRSNPKIKIDVDSDEEVRNSVKRSSSNGNDENPQKKAKINSTTAVKKLSTNLTKKEQNDDKDDELALFDLAFSSVKPKTISNNAQQLTARPVPNSNNSKIDSRGPTRAETAPDGRRIVHQPKTNSQSAVNLTIQPIIDFGPIGLKIPLKTRQDCLNLFVNELKKQKKTNGSWSDQVRMMEKEMFDKSTNKNTYLNLTSLKLRQLRAEQTNKIEQNPVKNPQRPRLVVSHSAMLSVGPLESNNKKTSIVDLKSLSENEIYTLMSVYRARPEDLTENGYPEFSLDSPRKVLIKNKNPIYKPTVKLPTSDPSIRLCCRCGKTYRINENGESSIVEDCIYHWGRIRPQRVGGQIEKRYSCCEQVSGAVGCSVANCHVHDSDENRLLDGFVKTEPIKKVLDQNQSPGIFAIDCEMCYTTDGLELVRVSVVNHKLETIIDSLVLPSNPILDYNTRWSGIQQTDLQNCSVRLEEIQRRLLKIFNEKTLLIGHSLESDLKALKIVHEGIIDTSLVFPHVKGKPFKRALKSLASEFLTKIIQESANGHNPIEDATVCMELMLWKIKGDLRGVANRR